MTEMFKILYMSYKMYFIKKELKWTRGKHAYRHSDGNGLIANI